MEIWGPQTLFIIVGALKNPVFSAILGFVAIFARILYSLGYMNAKGAFNPIRIAGALLNDITLFTSFVLSVIACISAYWEFPKEQLANNRVSQQY